MPNFHVHWLVAAQAAPSASAEIRAGLDAYAKDARAYGKLLLETLRGVRSEQDLPRARAAVAAARDRWAKGLLQGGAASRREDMTCFSAYALGACGPDFWTLPVDVGGPLPATASEHFDLGHYNRTHVQFERSIAALGARDDLEARVEKAYFLGMATHFAADLVIHQLVNVSAGAYNLQPKPWRNEQARGRPFWKNFLHEVVLKGTATLLFPGWPYPPDWRPFLEDNAANSLGLWSTHNKVEHYWDTYVRHRYLGDTGPLFGPADARDWNGFQPLGLPTCEGLLRQLGKELGQRPPEAVAGLLREPVVVFAIEKPLMLPWLFCERVRRGELRPFIYDRVVHPRLGAYPLELVPEPVKKEKEDDKQMLPDRRAAGAFTGPSEARRLEFFCSSLNDDDSRPNSWNYLTYFVCPDVEKVVRRGRDVFFHHDALGPFLAAAAQGASSFARELAGAYTSSGATLANLGRFWNLDAGLGLRVQNVETDTPKDVVTRLDLVHVFDVLRLRLGYTRELPWLEQYPPATYGFPEERAFEFRQNQDAYGSLAEISEPDQEAYLECIRLTEEARARQRFPPPVMEKEFWTARTAGHACTVEVPSASLMSGGPMKVQLLDLGHRLTLEFRMPIADLGAGPASDQEIDRLSLLAMCDRAQAIDGAVTGAVHDWTKKHWVREGAVLDFTETPREVRPGVQEFSTRVLLGFETDPDLKRVTDLGTWNNVVASHQLGRNVVIATGRRCVLHPTVKPTEIPLAGGKTAGTSFEPEAQYEYWADASPTEQVYFTLYPLVTTKDGVYDLFARERVTKEQLERLKAISSVGVVKVILLYALGGGGAIQLDTCWIDGVNVPVERVPRQRAS